MEFKVGDRVELLDDSLTGRVMLVSPKGVTVLFDEGFEEIVPAAQLVRSAVAGTFDISGAEVEQAKQAKIDYNPGKPAPRRSKKAESKMVVDLHAHQLVDSTKGMNNFDILNLQLDTARRRLEFAIEKGIQSVVFIHGVGEGVLKEELHYLFRRHGNISYFDADFRVYGQGATEIYIYRNG